MTIGSGKSPLAGALLDLKEFDNPSGGPTANKGLLLPRVHLTVKERLDDIPSVNQMEPNAKTAHTGLMVYNTNENYTDGIGISIWNGEQWNSISPITKIVKVEVPVLVTTSHFMAFASSTSLLDIEVLPTTGLGWWPILYNSVQIDSSEGYTTRNGIYRIKNAGTYNISARIEFGGLTVAGAAELGILIRKNGESYFREKEVKPSVVLVGTQEIEVSKNNIELELGDEVVFAFRLAKILEVTVANSRASYAIITQQQIKTRIV